MSKLAIIAITGLAVSAISLGLAISEGARDNKFDINPLFNVSWMNDGDDCKTSHATATSRSFNWGGDDEVSINVPADVHYKAGEGSTVEVKGDPELLSHLKVDDGEIEMSCSARHWQGQRLDITLPGTKTFREIDVKGSAKVDLADLNQPELEIGLAGSGEINAAGKTDSLKLSIAGHGEVHAKDLIAKKVEVDIAGHGNVETSPQDSAEISIAGRGDVKLYSEPKHIETSIMGSGNVEHLAQKS